MNKRVFQSCLRGFIMLFSTCARAYACGSGTATITALNTNTTDTYTVAALSSGGELTGYFYGSQPVQAFSYVGGVLNGIGTLGGMISEGFGVNSAGQIVGVSYTTNNAELDAFLYSGGSMIDLGTLGGGYSSASLINESGQVAGVSLRPGATDSTAFLYSQGVMASLGTLGGTYSSPFALNNAGQVAGESSTTSGDIHGFKASSAGILDLGTLGGNYSSAFWLNDAGVVVGESSLVNTNIHAFLSAGGAMSDLGTLGGTYSSAFQINSNGQVIGIATIPNDTETHGFIFSNGVMIDLGTLGGTSVSPYAINNLGQIVGAATLPDGTSRAFLWQQNQLVDLNTLVPAGSGWLLSVAQFINDAGRIVGSGTLNGAPAVFILDLATANRAPIAVAGPNQTIDCQAQATLNGSSSSDPDHDPLTFEWSSGGTVLGTNAIITVSLPMGTNVVVLKVTDTCGASSQTNLTVTVADTTPPVGSCPGPITVSADSNCQATVPDFTKQVVASDNCTPTASLVITQNPLAGTVVGLGQHPVVLTVTDLSGNSSACTVLLTVADTTPPKILSVPAPFSIAAGANCQTQVPNILGGVVASDSCTAAEQLVKSQTPAAGSWIGVGDQTLLVTVADASGNKATATVAFKVVDQTPPSFLSGPSPVKLSADAHCLAAVPNLLASVVVTDNCTPSAQIGLVQSPVAGTLLPVGNYTVVITATDAASNSSILNVSLQIADTTAPVILSAPTQVTVSADAHCQGQVPNVLSSILATDNCTPANQLTIVQSPVAGTVLPKGQSVIVVNVTDASGNTASSQVLLSIVDTTAPTIQSLAVSPNVLNPPNHQMVPVTVTAIVSDNCDSAPVTKITSITCSEVPAPGDIQITGNLTAMLAATKSSSGTTRVYTLNIQATDASGNVSTGVVTVTVPKSNGTGGSGNNKRLRN